MQLRTLELFCRVAEHRSISTAARESDLTQSAVSQAIGNLEDSLGAKLLDRSKRPLALTPAGETYLRGVREIMRRYGELAGQVQAISRQLGGVVRVGVIYSIGLSYMPDAKQAFEDQHRGVRVEAKYGTSSEKVTEQVLDGSVDFGLVSFPKTTKTLGAIKWQSEPMRLVCSSDHPLANHTEIEAQMLQGIEMVAFERGLVLRRAIDACLKKAGISVLTESEFDNADSMVRSIQANRGIGIVPEAAVRRETANGTLRVIACRELQMVRPLGIIYRRGSKLSTAAIEFGSLLLGREMEPELLTKTEAAKASRRDDATRNRAVSVVA